jgi:hypothetical protein
MEKIARAARAQTFTRLPFYENFVHGTIFTILIAARRIFTLPRDYDYITLTTLIPTPALAHTMPRE